MRAGRGRRISPSKPRQSIAWWMRWWVRAYGWVAGIADEYPPFETDPAGYGIDATLPRNDSPSRGWAVAGIFLVKPLAAIPHLFAVGVLMFVAMIGMWVGFVVVAFTGKLPNGLQDFMAGTYQWMIRVMAWVTGLTDEYPPFSLDVAPRQAAS